MQLQSALAVLCLLPVLACSGAGAQSQRAAPSESAGRLAVHRGNLRPRLVLTGELTAGRATALSVPRTSSWRMQIRWMERDGTPVRAGQKVVELDNSTFTSELDEKRSAARQAVDELNRGRAEAATALADKQYAVEEKKTDLQKAQLAAAVPEALLPQREFQDRQLALRKAELALDKANADLAAQRQASAADVAVLEVDRARAARQVHDAEAAIRALVLTAPRDGIVQVADHPWEGRKLHDGDDVWVGVVVVTLPDLTTLEVTAALSDVDDGRVRPGMRAVCTLDAYPEGRLEAEVVAVAAVAQEAARSSLLRSFKVRLRFLTPLDTTRLRPGMSVKVQVQGEETAGALLAPRAGLDLAATPPRARLAGGGEAPVRLGACDETSCVVLSGLADGAALRPAAGEGE